MYSADPEELRLYIRRVQPICHRLFNTAYAITGSAASAEYCLQNALLQYMNSGSAGGRHGFREGLRHLLIRLSLREAANTKSEDEWQSVPSESSDPVRALIAQESPQMRRILVLKHGCGLSNRRIAGLLDTDTRRIRTLHDRFEARLQRRLSAADRRKAGSILQQVLREDLSVPNPAAPEMSSVFRNFEADAVSVKPPSRIPSRIVGAVAALILALLCIAVFWLAAVLLQPAVLEDPQDSGIVETVDE